MKDLKIEEPKEKEELKVKVIDLKKLKKKKNELF